MPNILGQIIAISRGIGRRRRFLKNRSIRLGNIDKKWLQIQTQLRSQLMTGFQLSERDVIDYPDFLETNFDDLKKRLEPDITKSFEQIIVKMRDIENIFRGMIAGYSAHKELLGNYSGIIYENCNDSPVGGEHDDCDMIVVAKPNVSYDLERLAEKDGCRVRINALTSTASKLMGFQGYIVSICH